MFKKTFGRAVLLWDYYIFSINSSKFWQRAAFLDHCLRVSRWVSDVICSRISSGMQPISERSSRISSIRDRRWPSFRPCCKVRSCWSRQGCCVSSGICSFIRCKGGWLPLCHKIYLHFTIKRIHIRVIKNFKIWCASCKNIITHQKQKCIYQKSHYLTRIDKFIF